MEKEIKIKTRDKHIIYGTFTYSNSNKLIILVHGLSGHRNEHLLYNAAKFFHKKRYNVFRYDHYGDTTSSRKMYNMTLEKECDDLNVIIDKFKKYELYLIGHSFGGPTIINSENKKAKAAVLWDPTMSVSKEFRKFVKYESKIKKYILGIGIETLISKKTYSDIISINPKIIKNIKTPIKIIFAGKGILKNKWEKHISKIASKYDIETLKKAGHGFDEEYVEDELFSHSLKWLRKY